MLFLALSYLGFGAAIAAGMMMVSSLRLRMTIVASRMGMSLSYARTLWFIGTIIAWPVGLYVLLTGRLVFPTKEHAPTPDTPISKPLRSLQPDSLAQRQTDRKQPTENQHA